MRNVHTANPGNEYMGRYQKICWSVIPVMSRSVFGLSIFSWDRPWIICRIRCEKGVTVLEKIPYIHMNVRGASSMKRMFGRSVSATIEETFRKLFWLKNMA